MDGGLIKSLLGGLFSDGNNKNDGRETKNDSVNRTGSSAFYGGILKNLLSDPEKAKNLINSFGNPSSKKQNAEADKAKRASDNLPTEKSKSYVSFSDNPLIAAYLKSGNVVKHVTSATSDKSIKI